LELNPAEQYVHDEADETANFPAWQFTQDVEPVFSEYVPERQIPQDEEL
jgi:hypothetical protein